MQSTPVPESLNLPPYLDEALRVLVAPAGSAVSFTVVPEPESVTEARHFTMCRLDDWGLETLGDDVGLVVSELVTNALRHSGGGMPHPGSAQPGPTPYRGAAPLRETNGYRDITGCRDATGYRTSPYETRYGASHYEAPRPYHGAGCHPIDPLGSAPTAIRLRLLHQGSWLLCGIMDASPAAPRRKEPDYIAETGRGLHLVESFSDRWGWRALPEGKVVWALFRRP
ncbi:ATP-binding protein [Actinomadura miaoliensis]|uniref:ATP-binding protein n=1 Tax=Actinomadura miaoliensis TaxID=430685 RepID=A0ABP7VAT9_9ACTN